MNGKVEYYVGNLHVPDEIPDVAEEVDDDAPLSEWDREALRVFAGYEEDPADDELPEYDEEDE